MGRKTLTIGGGLGFLITAAGFFGRETVSWMFGKILDALPLPKLPNGSLNLDAIPWNTLFGCAFGIAGLLLVYRGARMAAVNDTSSMYGKLGDRAWHIQQQIRSYRNAGSYMRSSLTPLTDTVIAGNSLLVSFQNAGFAVPHFDTKVPERWAMGLEVYLSAMIPYLSDGHFELAKKGSTAVSERAQDLAVSTKVEDWLGNDF